MVLAYVAAILTGLPLAGAMQFLRAAQQISKLFTTPAAAQHGILGWSFTKLFTVILCLLLSFAFLKPHLSGNANSDGVRVVKQVVASATGTSPEAVGHVASVLRGTDGETGTMFDHLHTAISNATGALNTSISTCAHCYAEVRLEYKGDVCVNPDCHGPGHARLEKPGSDNYQKNVYVITMDGVFRGIQVMKRHQRTYSWGRTGDGTCTRLHFSPTPALALSCLLLLPAGT